MPAQYSRRRRTDAERFWSKVIKSEGCWLWHRRSARARYGSFWFQGKKQQSNRVAYVLTHGPISDNVEVCHTCDNTFCCNPEHLFLGTHSDNMRDCSAKDRSPLAKLPAAAIPEMRRLHATTALSYAALARMFGVHRSTASRIVRGKERAHIA